MMQIVYFSSQQQVFSALKKQAGEVKIVAPSPAKADALRSQLVAFSYDVITIAKFISELSDQLWEEGSRPNIKRKADLLLIFGILKNKYLPELGYEQFNQAYNLFSDLRSFSLSLEALSSVLDEQPQEIQQAINMFWQVLDVTGYLDEHGGYQKISEGLRSAPEIEGLRKTYVFWGFQHLNGQQIDLLKALAIRYDVIIPFPLTLRDKIKRSDWISWLKEAGVTEIVHPEEIIQAKGKWIKTNSRELANSLLKYLQDGDQVVLGLSKLSPSHMDIIPSSKVKFKIPIELLHSELLELSNILTEIIREKENLSVEELEQSLQTRLAEAIKCANFKKLKAIELYQEALKTIRDLTDTELRLDNFFLKLLYSVVCLNQPRTAFVPMSKEEQTINLVDMSSLSSIEHGRRVLFCLDDRFDDFQSLGQNYSEAIQKSLAALGPLKRNELELHFKQWEFRNVLASEEVVIFMSESILKHSLVWKRMFANVDLEIMKDSHGKSLKKILDPFSVTISAGFSGNFSASKLQTYLDCPRKFYYAYVEKIFPQLTYENDLDPMAMGTITHKIIEEYHNQAMTLENLPDLVEEVVSDHITKRQLKLPRETYLQRTLIFNHRAANGISFLASLKNQLNEPVRWKMEEEFKFASEFTLGGKIDCIGESERFIFLLDFKSTQSASVKDILGLENLQLWVYALAAKNRGYKLAEKHIVLGFVVLDKPSESVLLTTDAALRAKLAEDRICKVDEFSENFTEHFKGAEEKIHSLALTIKSEKNFPPAPRKDLSCRFCELSRVCVKSELASVE